MHQNTPLTQLLKVQHPIIQAPMAGGATTPALVAAVSNAFALGSFAAGYLPAQDIKRAINSIRQLTTHPFAVNLFVPESFQTSREKIQQMQQLVHQVCPELVFNSTTLSPPYSPDFERQIQVVVEEKVPVFSFTFGIPNTQWLDKLRKNGTILIGTATNLQEAILLEKNKIDIIVAQGKEAGGHRGTFIGQPENSLTHTRDLVTQFVQTLKTPVVAAGGIMQRQHIVDMLDLSASGVQMGSAFLTCEECGISPKFKEILLKSNKDCTVLTRAFSGKLARGINNEFIKRMQPYTQDILPYPIQHAITRPMRSIAEKQNNHDFMSLWAGQAAYLGKCQTVQELIASLV